MGSPGSNCVDTSAAGAAGALASLISASREAAQIACEHDLIGLLHRSCLANQLAVPPSLTAFLCRPLGALGAALPAAAVEIALCGALEAFAQSTLFYFSSSSS